MHQQDILLTTALKLCRYWGIKSELNGKDIISKSSKQAADGTGSSQQPTQPSFRKSGVYAAGIWVRETIGWWEMEGEEHSEVN